MCLFLFTSSTARHHATHRARYVRAGCPLAVGPGRSRTSDFLLLPQQVAVLLLSVLHVDQQRDEAVLNLHTHTELRLVSVALRENALSLCSLCIKPSKRNPFLDSVKTTLVES